ncbi:MAG: nickel-dependent hydrogenase large subunit [Spirochaetes bacterium]|nr:nickel-dependent hydrogenase large subunit [Spirochaetota bacterium]
MGARTIIPFGPQHPVLPEPIHLDLVLEDEKVVEAIPSIGFIHRGLERLAEKKDIHEMAYVSERICGICSFTHGMGYCTAIEAVMKIDVPERGHYLRMIWSEMSRIHSHLLWAGLLADGFGFENLFMQSWRLRERILDLIEETTGGRVIFGSCKIGGSRRDIADDVMARLLKELASLEKDCHAITDTFMEDSTVAKRTRGVGVIAPDDAIALGAVGPMLRASGVASDSRSLGYALYPELSFAPIVEKDGDCWARTAVRVREIYQSFDLIRQCAAKMKPGPVDVKVSGNPSGEYWARLEQPRGEVIYYVKGNGTKNLERYRVRTPTFANVPPLVHMLKNIDLADVPVIVLTIDPCISCTER